MARHSQDSIVRTLEEMRKLVDDLLEATRRGAVARCDCGHSSIAHALVTDGPAVGYRPCTVPDCDCIHFDDVGLQIEEYFRKRRMAEAEGKKYEVDDALEAAFGRDRK